MISINVCCMLLSCELAACSQVSLQQEEDEVEEFQLIEKLQQLGINAGSSPCEHLAIHLSRKLLQSKNSHCSSDMSQSATQQIVPQETSKRLRKQATTPVSPSS
jgi:hypothetical protein